MTSIMQGTAGTTPGGYTATPCPWTDTRDSDRLGIFRNKPVLIWNLVHPQEPAAT